MRTQCQRVLTYLESGKTLTQFEAITDLGILRLASRINDLRKDGHNILSRRVSVSNRFGERCSVASYKLMKSA